MVSAVMLVQMFPLIGLDRSDRSRPSRQNLFRIQVNADSDPTATRIER